MTTDVVWAFVTGFAGSLHCLGMCGPLVVAYSLHLRTGDVDSLHNGSRFASLALLRYHAAFHGGRIAAYGLAGLIVATAASIVVSSESLRSARSILSLAGGTGMVLLGLALLRIFAGSASANVSSFSGRRSGFARSMGALLRSTTTASRFALGFAAGFLPCMLSWAMAAKAAATANPLSGLSLMVSFGVGTAPALLFADFFASIFTLRLRLAGERLAAFSVIAMGLILIWKGISRLV